MIFLFVSLNFTIGEKKKIAITYIEDKGGHEWDFWDTYLKRFLEWLPLEDDVATLHSGNVTGE